MASEVFNLAILLTLKDAASGGLDRIEAKMRSAGKEGKKLADEYNSLRESLNRDLAIGGIGVAGLSMLYKGVKSAGDFQSSMTDLRTTMAQTTKSGQVDLNALGADMQQAEGIALKLGNALPGTTEDFISMIQTLKQGGLDVKTIFDGAAESVANLAVANNAAPRDMAKDFAKFGQIFKLKPEEYKPAADIFSKIYTSKGIESGEVIESSKYFQGRAGNALGMTGLKGADESVRLMSYLQKQGLESSQAGTSASTFFVQLAKNEKALESLKKEYGITFDLFDKKGEFKGIDNAVSELEKLKKLNPEQMLVALNKLGGEEGSMAGTALVQGGIEGWKQFNAEINKSISLTDKTKMKSADFNNQMEALTGTLDNLKVTVFEPILPGLTSAISKTNEFVGSIQEFAKANPELSKTVITLTAMASSAMVLYSGFKTLSTGVKLFRMASAFSSGDGLLSYLNSTKTAADAAGTSITTATTKARGLRGALQSQTVKIGVQIGAIMGIEFLIGVIQSEIQKAFDAGTAKKNALETTNKNYAAFQRTEKEGAKFSPKDFENQANTTWFSVMKSGLQYTLPSKFAELPASEKFGYAAKSTYLHPLTRLTGSTNPFAEGFFGGQTIKQGFQKTAPELADPRIMTAFLKQIDTRVPNPQEKREVEGRLQQAFPESFAAAMKELQSLNFQPLTQSFADLSAQMNAQAQAQTNNTELYNQQGVTLQNFGQNLSNLQNPVSQMQQDFQNLGNTANQVPPPLTRVVSSANSASGSLNNLSAKIENWQMPTPNVQTVTVSVPQSSATPNSAPFSIFPSHAVGGVVERDGVAMVHAGNVITPAKTKGFGAVNSLIQSSVRNYNKSADNSAVNSFANKNFAESKNFNSSANTSSINSFAANYLDARQTRSSPLENFKQDISSETSRLDSLPQTTVSGNKNFSPLGKQAADVQRVISQSANNQISVNYSPQVTINGASPTAKQDFQQMLNAHSKEIERLVARKMQNGRVRA